MIVRPKWPFVDMHSFIAPLMDVPLLDRIMYHPFYIPGIVKTSPLLLIKWSSGNINCFSICSIFLLKFYEFIVGKFDIIWSDLACSTKVLVQTHVDNCPETKW